MMAQIGKVSILGKRHVSSEEHNDSSGFTLLEMLLVLAIATSLMVGLRGPLQQFHRVVFLQQAQAELAMDLQRFQLILKTELSQTTTPRFQLLDTRLLVQADLNHDGDWQDSREQVAYRFDPSKQALLRKSGQGQFQRFLEGISDLKFKAWPSAPSQCLEITAMILGQTTPQIMVICASPN